MHGVQLKPFQTKSFEDDTARSKGKTSELRTKDRQDHMTPKGPKFKFTVGNGKSQGESSTQETQAHDEVGEGDEEDNEGEQEEEEEPKKEQELDEEEFDEEGLPGIPSTSQSQETQEGIPPTSCDIIGTTSVSFSNTISLGFVGNFWANLLQGAKNKGLMG